LNAIQLGAQTLRPYRIGDETLYLITAGSAVFEKFLANIIQLRHAKGERLNL
jgi:hypothetical protein